MRISFDMDGVIRYTDLGILKMCEIIGYEKSLEAYRIHRMARGSLILNPFDFATKDDEVFCVSHCSSKESAKRKRRWLQHYFGDRIKFVPIIFSHGGWKKEYVDKVAKMKVEKMLKLKIEVYFDDDPAIIRVMRTLTDKIKFIKYGPWIEEYY